MLYMCCLQQQGFVVCLWRITWVVWRLWECRYEVCLPVLLSTYFSGRLGWQIPEKCLLDSGDKITGWVERKVEGECLGNTLEMEAENIERPQQVEYIVQDYSYALSYAANIDYMWNLIQSWFVVVLSSLKQVKGTGWVHNRLAVLSDLKVY